MLVDSVLSMYFSAQGQGLLCEEQGNYQDNVKYCGYCSYHYKKLVNVSWVNFRKVPFLQNNRKRSIKYNGFAINFLVCTTYLPFSYYRHEAWSLPKKIHCKTVSSSWFPLDCKSLVKWASIIQSRKFGHDGKKSSTNRSKKVETMSNC